MNFEDLVLRIITEGVAQAESAMRRVSDSAEQAAGKASSSLTQTGAALVALFALVRGVFGELRQILSDLATISGVSIASQFAQIELSLRTVTGSAQTARNVLRQLMELGARTPYDTAQLSGFASQLIAGGASPGQAVSDLGTIADLASYNGVPNGAMQRFVENLIQIRGQDRPSLVDLRQAARVAPGLGRIVGAGLGTGNLTTQEAFERLQGMSGREAYETILRGTQAIAKGAAELQGLNSPTALLANLFERLQLVMLPTGQLLLQVLMPIGQLLLWVATGFQKINELTGGGAGLIVLIQGLAWVWGVASGAVIAARSAVDTLSVAVGRLAVVSGAASTALTVGTGVAGAAGAAGAIGLGGRIAGFLGGLLRGGGAAILVSLLGGFAGNAIAGDGKDRGRSLLGDAISNALTFGGIGATIGSFFGPGGAGIGALFGGTIGLIKTAFDYRGGRNPRAPEQSSSLERNMERAANALEEMRGQLFKGGPRGQAAVSGMEAERYILRTMMAGMG